MNQLYLRIFAQKKKRFRIQDIFPVCKVTFEKAQCQNPDQTVKRFGCEGNRNASKKG
jgi:hypothetical protein